MEETMKSRNSNKAAKKLRYQSALQRLKAQKASSLKPLESARLYNGNDGKRIMQDLTAQDIKRIDKEINTLTSKLSYAGK